MQTTTRGTIEDKRTTEERERTIAYAVATDSGLSGWGKADGGASYYALACASLEELEACEASLRARSEMKRVRVVGKSWRPKLRKNDHLSIAGPTAAGSYYRAT